MSGCGSRELTVALSDDPRLVLIDDPDERERVAATAPAVSGTALGQLEALKHRQPVMVPRWLLGGRMCPEVRDWPPYRDRRVRWFTLTADDTLTPA